MRFSLFYEFQVPQPWDDESEFRVVQEALEQVELADKLGYDCVWAVEHHFLEEYSHSSAPEVFLAACAARTKNIRIGHGIIALPSVYNHPARVAERVAMLDLVSDGRVEFGTGESTSNVELHGFGITRAEKRPRWEESLDIVIRMMTETPFKGIDGKFVQMPARNVIPKSRQKPHPPMWQACGHRAGIQIAASKGLGALCFAIVEPDEARYWVDHYYSTLESQGAAPHRVNPNVAVLTGFYCGKTEQEAIDKGLDGAHFFNYTLWHYFGPGEHHPGKSNIWEEFLANRDQVGLSKDAVVAAGKSLAAKEKLKALEREREDAMGSQPGLLENLRGAVGTPEQIAEFFRSYEEAGVDEIILVAQAGANKHEHIMESLELFAKEVMPEFKERDRIKSEEKRRRLEPVVEQVLARYEHSEIPDPGEVVVTTFEEVQGAAKKDLELEAERKERQAKERANRAKS